MPNRGRPGDPPRGGHQQLRYAYIGTQIFQPKSPQTTDQAMSLMMISRGHRSIVIVDHLHLPDDPGWDTVDVAE